MLSQNTYTYTYAYILLKSFNSDKIYIKIIDYDVIYYVNYIINDKTYQCLSIDFLKKIHLRQYTNILCTLIIGVFLYNKKIQSINKKLHSNITQTYIYIRNKK